MRYWIHWSNICYELFEKRLEKLQMDIAWHMPRWLKKWAFVHVVAVATTGPYSDTVVPELTVIEALERWDSK